MDYADHLERMATNEPEEIIDDIDDTELDTINDMAL